MNGFRTVESVSDRLGTKLLTFVLSVIAGSVDVIGFLGLGALFIAHITGNLVVLAARTAAGEHASAAHLLSVPVFIVALFAARLLAATFDRFAIAVQNVLVQVSLKEAPSTAVMTTNLTRFVVDLGEVWLGRDPGGRAKAVARARRTGTAIAGFVVGACLGAWCQAHVGLWSLTIPTGLAMAALVITYCSDAFVRAADRAQSPVRGEAV